jgi:hypothetical protein
MPLATSRLMSWVRRAAEVRFTTSSETSVSAAHDEHASTMPSITVGRMLDHERLAGRSGGFQLPTIGRRPRLELLPSPHLDLMGRPRATRASAVAIVRAP